MISAQTSLILLGGEHIQNIFTTVLMLNNNTEGSRFSQPLANVQSSAPVVLGSESLTLESCQNREIDEARFNHTVNLNRKTLNAPLVSKVKSENLFVNSGTYHSLLS